MSDEPKWLDAPTPNSFHWITNGETVWLGGYEAENNEGYKFIPLGPKPAPPPAPLPKSREVTLTAKVRPSFAAGMWTARVLIAETEQCLQRCEKGTQATAVRWVRENYGIEPEVQS